MNLMHTLHIKKWFGTVCRGSNYLAKIEIMKTAIKLSIDEQ